VNIQGDTIFPQVKPTLWCGEFDVNLEKYHTDGKKIYTRVDTVGYPAQDNGSLYND
jgi:hypothetical protein